MVRIRPETGFALIDARSYEGIRGAYLKVLRLHKAARRVRVCSGLSLLFESRQTVQGHIQEVLRAEGGGPERAQRLVEEYRALVPESDELCVTAFVDGEDNALGRQLAHVLAFEPGCLFLEGPARCSAQPIGKPELGAVHYLRFRPVPPEAEVVVLELMGERWRVPLPPAVRKR